MSEAPAPAMSSSRPYLVRALVEWINDNGLTPHIQVDARMSGVRVPPFAVREGKVTLNIALRAVAHLRIDNEAIAFQARFGGVSQSVYVPMNAVEAVYARENAQGMVFPPDSEPNTDAVASATSTTPTATVDADPAGDGAAPPVKKPPHLRVIK